LAANTPVLLFRLWVNQSLLQLQRAPASNIYSACFILIVHTPKLCRHCYCCRRCYCCCCCCCCCRDLTTKDKAAAEAELVKAAGQIEELKKEVDVRIAAFLKEEQIGQDKVALFNVLQQEVRTASLQACIPMLYCAASDTSRTL
jgi:hypothetical protein